MAKYIKPFYHAVFGNDSKKVLGYQDLIVSLAHALKDDKVLKVCGAYFPNIEKPHSDKEGFEKAQKVISYLQEHYQLIHFLGDLSESTPKLFKKYFGDNISIEYRYGDLNLISPEQGSVLLDVVSFHAALDLYKTDEESLEYKKILNIKEDKAHSFACLMQVIESLVLHEAIYILDSPLGFEDTPFEKTRYIFHVLPKSYEVENELMQLPSAIAGQLGFSIHPTDSGYSFLTAAKVGLPYRPDPERGVHSQWIIPSQNRTDYYTTFAEGTTKTIEGVAITELQQMNQLLSEARFTIETPLIFNYVLDENQKRNEPIIDTALRVRESKEARAFRKFCGEFDFAARVGDDTSLYKIKKEIDNVCQELKSVIQQPTIPFDIQFPFSVSLNPVELWKFVQHKRKRHLIFIDNLYQTALKSKDKYMQMIRTLR